MQEMWVRSLGLEDPLEKEMATYSSVLAWKVPWTEEPIGLQSMELQGGDMAEQLNHEAGPSAAMLGGAPPPPFLRQMFLQTSEQGLFIY